MKQHSTNYTNTFIEVSEDTKTTCGTKPPSKEKKTVAEMQYEIIASNPYKYTSDDVSFQVFAERNDLTKAEYEEVKIQFFSKGQPCFRASPLTKNYGFGVHSDATGKVAIYGMESAEYQKYLEDPTVKKVKAMNSKR